MFLPKKERGQLWEVIDMLMNLNVGILSQGIHISNDHVVHFKYSTILFVNYTSVKLGGKEIKEDLNK